MCSMVVARRAIRSCRSSSGGSALLVPAPGWNGTRRRYSAHRGHCVGPRRVVVTGLGCVTPLGIDAPSTWRSLLAGKNGIMSLENPSDWGGVSVAARVRGGESVAELAEAAGVAAGAARSHPRYVQLALAAAGEALRDAGLRPDPNGAAASASAVNQDAWSDGLELTAARAGVALGSSLGSLDEFRAAFSHERSGRLRRVSPHFVPRILANMPAGHISLEFNLQGPNHCASTACATGAHSIADAFRFIRDGYADVMVCGGTEAAIDPVATAGFARARALSSASDPRRASRPFDPRRDGFVIGEGAGVLILEDAEHAAERGARAYAEIAACGMSGDAFHTTAGRPDGSAAARAVRDAIYRAGWAPKDVSMVNAHATSTPRGDAAECAALASVFGDDLPRVAVTSNKGALGHLLGAAGAVEAVATALSLYHRAVPCTLGAEFVDDELAAKGLRVVLHHPLHDCDVERALSNSFGFGGTNCVLAMQAVPSATRYA